MQLGKAAENHVARVRQPLVMTGSQRIVVSLNTLTRGGQVAVVEFYRMESAFARCCETNTSRLGRNLPFDLWFLRNTLFIEQEFFIQGAGTSS